MTLLIDIQNPEQFDLPDEAALFQWANAAWLAENEAGVVLRVVGLEESQALNREFRGKDYPTNILSFPYEPPDFDFSEAEIETDRDIFDDYMNVDNVAYLGDLVLCLPVLVQEALEQGKHVDHHWAHLIVHGVLHLQGFDHERDLEAALMEQREITILEQLSIPNPYLLDRC